MKMWPCLSAILSLGSACTARDVVHNTLDTAPLDRETEGSEASPGAADETPPLQGLLVAQDWNYVDAPLGTGAGQYRIIYLQASMGELLPEIRAANPDALLFAYQKVGGMREDGGDSPSTGVQIQEAEEAWFLHDAAGNRLYYCDYPQVAAADIGHPGYQARWLSNVRTRMLRDGFDGVMLDDVNTFPGHCLGSQGTPIAEYPTDEAYGAAVVDFMTAVGPALLDDGLRVAPNVAMNPWNDVQYTQTLAMLPAISHLAREYWMRWDDSANFTDAEWTQTLALLEEVEAQGVGFLALTYGPGAEGVAAGQRYGRASFLLAWDGQQDSAWGYFDGALDPWSPEWALSIGQPQGARAAVDGGWMRRYTQGIVLVNPSSDAVLSVTLSQPHVDASGDRYESVALRPGEAAILRRADAP